MSTNLTNFQILTLSDWQDYYTNKIQGIQLSTLNDLLSDITWIINRKN